MGALPGNVNLFELCGTSSCIYECTYVQVVTTGRFVGIINRNDISWKAVMKYIIVLLFAVFCLENFGSGTAGKMKKRNEKTHSCKINRNKTNYAQYRCVK